MLVSWLHPHTQATSLASICERSPTKTLYPGGAFKLRRSSLGMVRSTVSVLISTFGSLCVTGALFTVDSLCYFGTLPIYDSLSHSRCSLGFRLAQSFAVHSGRATHFAHGALSISGSL